MSNAPLMPMATAVWLVENTTLTFKQIAEFCKMHEVEIQGIADGEVGKGIKAYNPIIAGQLTKEEIDKAIEKNKQHPYNLRKKSLSPKQEKSLKERGLYYDYLFGNHHWFAFRSGLSRGGLVAMVACGLSHCGHYSSRLYIYNAGNFRLETITPIIQTQSPRREATAQVLHLRGLFIFAPVESGIK